MPRRPNKTDYGMLDIDADIESFYRMQGNEEVDEFLLCEEKRRHSLNPIAIFLLVILPLFGIDFFRIYEMGWNDGHSNGFRQGKQESAFYKGRKDYNAETSADYDQLLG